MSDWNRKQTDFVAYDYKEVITDSSRASFLLDGYENFGWELDENYSMGSHENLGVPQPSRQGKIVLKLRRNRKIVNKMELTRLQRNFEACIQAIEELEKSKTSMATIYALMIALFGTAFMAGSTFAVTSQPPYIILCIALAIPGFTGWILPYFVYQRVAARQTGKVTPMIEEKFEEIYEVCEKGNKLLH